MKREKSQKSSFNMFSNLIFSILLCFVSSDPNFDPSQCSSSIKSEVQSKADVVNRIIEAVVNGSEKGKTYEELAYFVDTFGHRMSGSNDLETSIDYIVKKLEDEDFIPVTDQVEVFNWKRGNEWLWMTSPVRRKLNIIGMGGTVGTDGQIWNGSVIILEDPADITLHKVNGTVVLMKSLVKFTADDMARLMSLGCKAVLRTVDVPIATATPHTRMTSYQTGTRKVPFISISLDDALMFQRMNARSQEIVVEFFLNDTLYSKSKISRNVIVDLKGKTKPDEMVILSGHIDSWDVGDGAMDDGGGSWISLRALEILKKLDIQPKRTIRTLLFTGEEQGLIGAQAYVKKHAKELEQISIILESDGGTFDPRGLIFFGTNLESQCYIYETLKLLSKLNSTKMYLSNGRIATDIAVFRQSGVPTAHLKTKDDNYFIYHHSIGDRINVLSKSSLDLCTAVWAALAYVLADLEKMLPK